MALRGEKQRWNQRARGLVALAAILLAGLLTGAPNIARADGADGKALFEKNCAGCHGAEGKADTPMAPVLKVPPLAGTKLDADAIVKHVREAKSHAVPSQALSDEELAQVAAAVKAL